ncbi:hypothetical protein ACFRR7_17845 [Streptomyces sp. NPDC056909]|uniref:hypothetical protein n=1 Tax=Streptomyces sp. NPDC056909 TaxID=3345963 RepID=UPI0036BCB691
MGLGFGDPLGDEGGVGACFEGGAVGGEFRVAFGHHPRNIYLRESWILTPLDNWLARVFLPHHLDNTIDLMSATVDPGHDSDNTATRRARTAIAAVGERVLVGVAAAVVGVVV